MEKIKIGLREQILIGTLLCIFNIIMLLYSLFNKNTFLMGYSIGFSAFSTYFLNQKIKSYREEVQKLWSGLTK